MFIGKIVNPKHPTILRANTSETNEFKAPEAALKYFEVKHKPLKEVLIDLNSSETIKIEYPNILLAEYISKSELTRFPTAYASMYH